MGLHAKNITADSQGKIEVDCDDSFKSVDSEASLNQPEDTSELQEENGIVQYQTMTTETFRLVELDDTNWKSCSLKLESYLSLQDL